MFLQSVKVKAFARGVKQHGPLPREWNKYRHCLHRIVKTTVNKQPEDVYTVIGKTSLKEGWTEYLGYEEGNIFNQIKSRPVYIIAKGLGRRFCATRRHTGSTSTVANIGGINLNLYEVSYPAGMWGDHPAYSFLKTEKSAGSAKYDEWLEASECWDISFIDFCKIIRVSKVGQSEPLPKSEPFKNPERIELVNRLIREIGNRGR